ncbi:MAG: hypothetical protein AB1450_06835 [Pseudomonadota bacterium]
MDNTPFEISHTWGDPREPDYRNNARVSFAHYKEGDIHLFFAMYPITPEKGGPVVVEVPAYIRERFGNDWSRCQIAIQRVVDYLKSLNESKVHRKYTDLVVDTSKVPKWLPVQLKLFTEKHTFFIDTLPAAKTFPFVSVGLITAYYKEVLIGVGFNSVAVNWALIAIGITILWLLLSDIGKRWLVYRNPPIFLALHGWTLSDTMSGTFKRYGRRYCITLCFSLLIISESFR